MLRRRHSALPTKKPPLRVVILLVGAERLNFFLQKNYSSVTKVCCAGYRRLTNQVSFARRHKTTFRGCFISSGPSVVLTPHRFTHKKTTLAGGVFCWWALRGSPSLRSRHLNRLAQVRSPTAIPNSCGRSHTSALIQQKKHPCGWSFCWWALRGSPSLRSRHLNRLAQVRSPTAIPNSCGRSHTSALIQQKNHPCGWSFCWWALRGSNSRPSRCKRDALPAELSAHFVSTECLIHSKKIKIKHFLQNFFTF